MDDEQVYRFTVCICTRNRPQSLDVALQSVAASEYPIAQVIVSDDSTDSRTEDLLGSFPKILYVKGERRGLGANRNCAVRNAVGTHVLFIDDDAAVKPDFFNHVVRTYENLDKSLRSRTIVSGLEVTNGRQIYPKDLGFLGYMDKPRPTNCTRPLRTAVINATVFPLSLFTEIGFDESLIYGYDEADITTRSTALGYNILLEPSAINEHYSTPAHKKDYLAFSEASRLYTSLKRYLFVERKPLKASVYVPYALGHLVLNGFKYRRMAGVSSAFRSAAIAATYVRNYCRTRSDSAPLYAEITSAQA